jgi:ABC transport system ATP-binding/permease protein
LLEYRGALVLVTHDRYMLDRVSTVVLGLDGFGGAERFADYSQWDVWQREHELAAKINASGQSQNRTGVASAPKAALSKRKLSYKEARELETIEQRIADGEKELQAKHDALLDPAIMSDAARLYAASLELDLAQKAIDRLYARWVQLEQKEN